MFKLVNDGKSTYIELDGKKINDVKAVRFTHETGDKKPVVTLSLDIDITRKGSWDGPFIEDVKPDYFTDRIKMLEKAESERRHEYTNQAIRATCQAMIGD